MVEVMALAMALILVGTIPVALSAQQPAIVAGFLVFDRVTIVDVEHGKLVPDQRVVIAGNRIQAVGSANQVDLPKGAQVVDARGKYLIPGLWDMHLHPQDQAMAFFYPLLIANGVTGIRDAWSDVPLDTLVRWRREILAGTRVGPPRQLLAGASFGQHYPDTDRASVERIVDSLKAHGANFLKVYPYSPIVATAARRAGLPFGGHMVYFNPFTGEFRPVSATPIEASDSGMRIFDHLADSKLSNICFHGGSVDACRPIAERFRRNGSWWVPTLIHSGNGNHYGEVVATYLAARAAEFWDGASLQGNWLRDSVRGGPPHLADVPAESLGYLRIAQRAGLPILAGTDDGTRKRPPGFFLHAELAAYVAEGLTPLEALQAATLNPAKLLGGTDSLGTVAPGKLADLVLLDADPLVDITNTTAIRAVVANGGYFDRAALDSLLAEIRTRNKQEP